MFISPMLASPFPKTKTLTMAPGEWIAQEKFDGHRLVVHISSGQTNLFTNKSVTAWSRNGLVRKLPGHLVEAFSLFPDVTLDGELFVPGERSYGVTEIVNGPDLVFYAFDLLTLAGTSTHLLQLGDRRGILAKIFQEVGENGPIRKTPSFPVNTHEEIATYRDQMWAAGKEGLILKRNDSIYVPGKRSKDWIKIKDLQSAVLTVTGFMPSRGAINDRGPFAMTLLVDDAGNATAVKTRNDAECRKLEQENLLGISSVGRKLRIEFQERTPDGNYRHPRWDRWEDE